MQNARYVLLALATLSASACAHRATSVAHDAATPVATVDNNTTVSSEVFGQAGVDRVFFNLDSSDLNSEARATLQRQATWLQGHRSVRVRVAGNCDERGTREYNLALGARRAAAAKAYLVSLGVDATRIDTISYGKDRPLDARPNENGWSVNRNAQTMVLNGPSS